MNGLYQVLAQCNLIYTEKSKQYFSEFLFFLNQMKICWAAFVSIPLVIWKLIPNNMPSPFHFFQSTVTFSGQVLLTFTWFYTTHSIPSQNTFSDHSNISLQWDSKSHRVDSCCGHSNLESLIVGRRITPRDNEMDPITSFSLSIGRINKL